MNRMQAQVEGFHRLYNVPVSDKLTMIFPSRHKLRVDLIREELEEFETAQELSDVADALGDLLYVVFGSAVEYGIDLEPVFEEIHKSNLSKLGADGKPIYAENGKVLKGPNYAPPDIKKVLSEQRLPKT